MTTKEIGTLLATSAIGQSKGEAVIGSAAAFIGFIATDYLGGWDTALKVMVYLMIADYISGLLGAIRTRTVNSEVMFWGGIRKAVVLGVIALAVLLDQFMGAEAPIFRTLALYFYAGREGLSVVENLGPLGVPLPPALTNFLKQLQQKGESK
ncbi:phage holin family protein [Paenibacillus radicis (ex Xue et al. 2023)]|uniref:Phage holin family protein n=1 Tax=Paenibacillus radicis (ex Xue et al. 2023) TaxID=2972489 RepID=A0ABT1YRC9_9BACL|nr:phage holin family protein [Paenibacillus radicis (ex Xue et al. 2023)]MCR8635737.1 phage holin family protein [Paenibacillus radicis (ex Xue et al. 2023)]